MYIDTINLILLLLSIFAGATCFYAAVVGFSFEGFYGQSFVPFAIIGFIGAWYSIWAGIRNTEILNQYTFMVTMSTVLTGYTGPAIYLLSRSVVNIYKKLDPKLYWLFLFGLFGSSFSIYAIFDVQTADRIQRAYVRGEVYSLGIWFYMYICHVLELIVFTIISSFFIVKTLLNKRKTSKEKLPAKLVLAGIGIAVFSIILSAVIPFFHPDSILIKFGPLITLPIIIITYLSTINSRNLQKKAFEWAARNETIEQQLRTARLMQAKLLPPREHCIKDIAIHATYLPMEKVGGDFYEIDSDENCLMTFIADVSGHGIPGAFMATMSKILFKQITSIQRSPSEVLKELNSQMLQYVVEGNFLTAFLGFIDFETKIITYTCAGHVPAIVYRSSNSSLHELPVNGHSVGWHPKSKFRESTFQLQQGDRLILYTDGIIECSNNERELYGNDRLNQFIRSSQNLRAEDFSNKLIEDLHEFMDEDTFDDDITLVIIDISNG